MADYSRDLRACLAFAGVLALAVLLALGVKPTEVSAQHMRHFELSSMHLSNYHEQFCVQVENGTLTQGAFYSRVWMTLYNDNLAEDWDSLSHDGNWYRLYFVGQGSTPCSQLPNRAEIEIEYYSNVSGCGGPSCAWLDVTDFVPHNGHYDYAYGYVRFNQSHVNGSSANYHHTINHETGHILGLADANCSIYDSNPCPNVPSMCGGSFISIMHRPNSYCTGQPFQEWPSWEDRWCVDDLAFHEPGGGCHA